MISYPKIEQFRNIVKRVRSNHDYQGDDLDGSPIYLHKEAYPILDFTGTVKVHGSNAGIVKYKSGQIEYQSRSRVLTEEYDNADFMKSMVSVNAKELFDIISFLEYKEYIAIYGEWCGGNIQKGVAINGLDKMFIIFGLRVDGEFINVPSYLKDHSKRIYNIAEFTTFKIKVDFNNPEYSQNEIIKLTDSVESKCPVGDYFGLNGIGEGIVFTCETDKTLMFKSKGEKHSVTKVEKLNEIDLDEVNKINTFVEYSVTINRLKQGVSFLKDNRLEIGNKSIGVFLRWIVNDIRSEEWDLVVELGIDEKKVNKGITKKAKSWFLNNLIE